MSVFVGLGYIVLSSTRNSKSVAAHSWRRGGAYCLLLLFAKFGIFTLITFYKKNTIIMNIIYACRYCQMTYQGKNKFVSHVSRYPSGKTDRFKCVFENCYTTLSSSQVFKAHLGSHESKGKYLSKKSFNYIMEPKALTRT